MSERAERMPASERADGALPLSQVGSLWRRSVEGSSNQSAAAHGARETRCDGHEGYEAHEDMAYEYL